jgi:ABC-type nitrate/sulfonate/bicarbonate transport system permease component
MKKYLLPIITGVCFLIFWQIAVMLFHIENWILPGPLQIIYSFWQAKSLMFYHMIPTIFEATVGLVIAAFLGIIIAILMEFSESFRKILYPFLILSQTIPFIILAPLLTLWLGFGLLPKVIIVAIVCFFPITINLFDGFSSVEPAILRLLKSMGATKIQVLRWVKWPSSLPSFFSGLRIAATYSILGAVISEWIGTDRGLGILLTRSAKSYLTDRVFATIGIITFLSIAVVLMVEGIARISIPWHYSIRNSLRKI